VRSTGQRVKLGTDPKISAARVLRDGKELPRAGTSGAPGPKAQGVVRAVTSPALQEIPRRKDPKRGPDK
jgi:hypothetical protein